MANRSYCMARQCSIGQIVLLSTKESRLVIVERGEALRDFVEVGRIVRGECGVEQTAELAAENVPNVANTRRMFSCGVFRKP